MRWAPSPFSALPALLTLVVSGCAADPALVQPDAGHAGDGGAGFETYLSLDAGADQGTLLCDRVVATPYSDGTESRTYYRDRWDSERRIRAEERREDASFDGTVALAWRYDVDGKILAYAGFKGRSFQHDREYDEHGNLSDFRLSYPENPDLTVPSSADLWMGTRYEHEYDAQGLLRSSVVTPYGPGNETARGSNIRYEHDAAERCVYEETTVPSGGADSGPFGIRYMYDEQSRIIEEHETGRRNGPFACTGRVTLSDYDEQGRRTRVRTWICGHAQDQHPDMESTYRYAKDGSRRLETFDFLTDVANDIIDTADGEKRSAAHFIENQSAGCAALDAAIGGPATQHCTSR